MLPKGGDKMKKIKIQYFVLMACLAVMILTSGCTQHHTIKAKVEAIQTEIQKSMSMPEGIEGEIVLKVKEIANEDNWKYTWKLTFKNNRKTPVLLTAEIQFQDKDGFEVDWVLEEDLCVNAGEEKSFTGSWFISPSEEVSRIYIKVISQKRYIRTRSEGQEFKECDQVSNK